MRRRKSFSGKRKRVDGKRRVNGAIDFDFVTTQVRFLRREGDWREKKNGVDSRRANQIQEQSENLEEEDGRLSTHKSEGDVRGDGRRLPGFFVRCRRRGASSTTAFGRPGREVGGERTKGADSSRFLREYAPDPWIAAQAHDLRNKVREMHRCSVDEARRQQRSSGFRIEQGRRDLLCSMQEVATVVEESLELAEERPSDGALLHWPDERKHLRAMCSTNSSLAVCQQEESSRLFPRLYSDHTFHSAA